MYKYSVKVLSPNKILMSLDYICISLFTKIYIVLFLSYMSSSG